VTPVRLPHPALRRVLLLGAAVLLLPSVLTAQAGASLPDSLFTRAQRLVNEGGGTAARAFLDSLVRVTPEGSEARADALYWRAQLAPDATAAQRDFARVTVEYPLSRRAPEALLGLAQLDVARGEPAAARTLLQRLILEHPTHSAATEAWFWLGRVQLDAGEGAAGCAALDSARARLGANEVERRNVIEFAAAPCRSGAALRTPAPAAPPAAGRGAAATPPTTARDAATPPATAARGQWSVQAGALTTKADAERLAARLTARGYDARVWDATPNRLRWRVRVGYFATRAEATAMVAKLKGERIDGFVVEAEGR
jgi:cell division septation protein DedD